MRIRARSVHALSVLPAAALVALLACENSGSSSSSGSPEFDSGAFDAGNGQGTEAGTFDAAKQDGSGGDSGGPLGPGHIVYLLGQDVTTEVGIFGITLDPATGAHAPLDLDAVTPGVQSRIDAGPNPIVFTATPSKSFLYAVSSGTETIAGFAVDTRTGALTPIDADPATAGIQPFPIPAGTGGNASYILASEKHVYVSKSSGASIAVFDIGANGSLTAQASPLFTTPTQPRGMVLSPAGDLLFVVNQFPSTASAFKVDPATGALSNRVDSTVAGVPVNAGPLTLVAHPTKSVVYVAGGDNGSVEALSYDATGTLTSLGAQQAGPPDAGTGGGGTIIGIAIDPAGKFVYSPNANSPFVDAFALDPGTGALGTKTSFTEFLGTQSAVVDPSGKFLLASGEQQLLQIFAIDGNGGLTLQPKAIYGTRSSYGGPIVVVPH